MRYFGHITRQRESMKRLAVEGNVKDVRKIASAMVRSNTGYSVSERKLNVNKIKSFLKKKQHLNYLRSINNKIN